MGKRANTQAPSKVAPKKPKVDPALASVIDAIKKAEHLPERCRSMLIDMMPFSLVLPSDSRLDVHTQVVGMIEETLLRSKAAMESSVSSTKCQVEDINTQVAELASVVQESEAAVTAQKERVETAKSCLADATDAANMCETVLADKKLLQKSGDAKLTDAQQERNALDIAFKSHFQVPMENTESPHFKELEPFLLKLELETSLLDALPGTCAKTKENRGNFDNVVLEELDKALAKKLAALDDVIEAETPAMDERAAAVRIAEEELETKKEAQATAKEEFENAQTLASTRGDDLSKAKQAVQDLQLRVECLIESQQKTESKLKAFESGPLNNFMTYKTKMTMPVEAAPAGA
jgi:hypothetical protein